MLDPYTIGLLLGRRSIIKAAAPGRPPQPFSGVAAAQALRRPPQPAPGGQPPAPGGQPPPYPGGQPPSFPGGMAASQAAAQAARRPLPPPAADPMNVNASNAANWGGLGQGGPSYAPTPPPRPAAPRPRPPVRRPVMPGNFHNPMTFNVDSDFRRTGGGIGVGGRRSSLPPGPAMSGMGSPFKQAALRPLRLPGGQPPRPVPARRAVPAASTVSSEIARVAAGGRGVYAPALPPGAPGHRPANPMSAEQIEQQYRVSGIGQAARDRLNPRSAFRTQAHEQLRQAVPELSGVGPQDPRLRALAENPQLAILQPRSIRSAAGQTAQPAGSGGSGLLPWLLAGGIGLGAGAGARLGGG